MGSTNVMGGSADGKGWVIIQKNWQPQSLAEQSRDFKFPLFRPSASEGLYAPSLFGQASNAWKTLAAMTYDNKCKHELPHHISRQIRAPKRFKGAGNGQNVVGGGDVGAKSGSARAIKKKAPLTKFKGTNNDDHYSNVRTDMVRASGGAKSRKKK